MTTVPPAAEPSRIAWIHMVSGVAGDMLLGALVDLGADVQAIQAAVRSLDLPDVRIVAERTRKGALAAVGVRVLAGDRDADAPVTDEHAHDHPHRGLDDILARIGAADLPPDVAERSAAVFRRLARAEAAVHGTSPDRVAFHEVGAVDAMADVVGACMGLHLLGIERVHASPFLLGRGTVRCAHGELPVPVPAVLELVRGAPVRPAEADGERTTPTGAALVTEWVADGGAFGDLPPMTPEAVGIGAGRADFDPVPNIVRVVVGHPAAAGGPGPQGATSDAVRVLETRLDDQSPESLGVVVDRLLAAGALDADLRPGTGKKGRPTLSLEVIVPDDPGTEAAVADVLLRQTVTLGLRRRREDRWILPRRVVTLDTDVGPVRAKLAVRDGVVVRGAPEHDDVVAAAERTGRDLPSTLEAARAALARAWPPGSPAPDPDSSPGGSGGNGGGAEGGDAGIRD